MSFWNSIGQVFEHAADDIAHAAEVTGDTIAKATVSGANLFATVWKDMFNGDVKQGITEIGMGMYEGSGLPMPPGVTAGTLRIFTSVNTEFCEA